MKIEFVDVDGYFPPKEYKAKIKNIEKGRFRNGIRLMIWFEIFNEQGSSMLITDFFTDYISQQNKLGSFYKKVLPGMPLDGFDTDELIGKDVNIVLTRKARKGKTYLNVVSYRQVKETKPKKAPCGDDLAGQLAEIINAIRGDNDLRLRVARVMKKQSEDNGNKKGARHIGDILKEGP